MLSDILLYKRLNQLTDQSIVKNSNVFLPKVLLLLTNDRISSKIVYKLTNLYNEVIPLTHIKDNNAPPNNEIVLDFDGNELVFGKYMRVVRQAQGISIRKLAKSVAKTPTYISDIEKGNNRPPEKELLEKIILELGLQDDSNVRNVLFDLAAKERNDIPADIKDYLMGNTKLLKIIRTAKEKPNDDQIWNQVSEII